MIISQGSGNPSSYAQTSETITGTVDPDPVGFQAFGVPGGYAGGAYISSISISALTDCVVLAPLLHNIITVFDPYTGEVVAEVDISAAWLEAGDFPLYAASDPATVFPYSYSEEDGGPPPETSAYAIQTFKRFNGATHIPGTPIVVFSPAGWFFEGDYARWASNTPPWTYSLFFGVLDLSDMSFKLVPIDLTDLNFFEPPDFLKKRLYNLLQGQLLSETAPKVNGRRLTVYGSSSGEVFIPGQESKWVFPGVRDIFSIDGNQRPEAAYRKVGDVHQFFQPGGSGLLAQTDYFASTLCVAVLLSYDGSNWTSKVYQQFAVETNNILLSQVCWAACGAFENGGKLYIAPQYVKRRGFVPFEPSGSAFGASRAAALANLGLGATLGTLTIAGSAEVVLDDKRKSARVVYSIGLADVPGGRSSIIGVPSIAGGLVHYATSRGVNCAMYTQILSLDTTVMDKYEEGVLFNLPTLPTLVSENCEDLAEESQALLELDIDPTIGSTTISFAPEGAIGWRFEVGHPLSSGCAINTDSVATNSPTFTPAPAGFYSFENKISTTGNVLPYSPPSFEGASFFSVLEANVRSWMELVKKDTLSEIQDILRYPQGFYMYRLQGNPIPLRERGFVYTPSMGGQLGVIYDPFAKPRNVIIGSELEVQRARLFDRPKFIVDEATSRKTLSATRVFKPVSISRPSSMQKCGQVFRLEQRRFPTVTDKSVIPCYFRGQVTSVIREATTPDYGAITPLSLGVDQGGNAGYLVPYNPRGRQGVVHQRIFIDSNATTRYFPSDAKDGRFVIKSETTDAFTQAIIDADGQATFDRPTGL